MCFHPQNIFHAENRKTKNSLTNRKKSLDSGYYVRFQAPVIGKKNKKTRELEREKLGP